MNKKVSLKPLWLEILIVLYDTLYDIIIDKIYYNII